MTRRELNRIRLKALARNVANGNASGFGFKKIGRGFKKVGRGVKKGAKGAYRGVKVVGKVTAYAMKRLAKIAARPIIKIVNKLANRRAKYVAYKRSGSTTTTLADRKAGGQYALSKVKKAGPFGVLAVKILKFTGGVTSGGDLCGDVNVDLRRLPRMTPEEVSMCGMTGVEIASAALKIVTQVKKIMGGLNKPGEAPANPASASSESTSTESTETTSSSDENASTDSNSENASTDSNSEVTSDAATDNSESSKSTDSSDSTETNSEESTAE
jgi:hypothetical protein